MFRNIEMDGDRLWKYGVLVPLLCMLAWSIDGVLERILINSPEPKYDKLFLPILLILYHIAVNFTKEGLARKVMKAVVALGLVAAFSHHYLTRSN
jgi:hypothetical protein